LVAFIVALARRFRRHKDVAGLPLDVYWLDASSGEKFLGWHSRGRISMQGGTP